MIKIRFIPIFEDDEFIDAVNEYTQIWDAEGTKILDVFKKITNLSFIENRIAVVVYEGISFSGRTPNDVMKLRASYDADTKKGTLIHELSHRLLFNIKNRVEEDEHKTIYLFLFDVWVELYGEDFAKKMVQIEMNRGENYMSAWNYALSLTNTQRSDKFLSLQLTGLQGDVMKESMNVALTLAWNLTPNNRKQYLRGYYDNDLNINGLHIHCPEGSVPKDGPSAGTAITTAIYSILNDIKIKHDIAITGEISFDGNITEIGGLDLKILGAIKAGVK